MGLDRYKSIEQVEAERLRLRAKFIIDIPVGTLVENVSLWNNGKVSTANTTPGAIYEDKNCTMVNVEKINGEKGLDGVWIAAYVRKLEKSSEKLNK